MDPKWTATPPRTGSTAALVVSSFGALIAERTVEALDDLVARARFDHALCGWEVQEGFIGVISTRNSCSIRSGRLRRSGFNFRMKV
jgi:hypothetical protein